MVTLADSLVSSASRPLALRMRPDLSARRHRYHGRTYWVVKEPIGLNYFRFHEEEFEILGMLDGHSSMEDIKERFERQFTPQKITFQDLQQFIGMLHRSGLVTSVASGQGHQLKMRRDQKKRRELLGKLSNVFALRWRGADPERFLTAIYPYTGWFFSPLMIVCVLVLGLSALSLVAVQFEEFQSRLPTFHQFFGAHNWIYLGATMAAVKVLHEFGHGLTCKRYGGECHELGFMLLVFTPALYCNVSDSWMLPNKWHRVFIGAGGMYVEIFIASVATFLWWFSVQGTLVNQLCLSMMFICSVSTLVFNGNPLLRFDGYYILMDIIEIPNLRQKSTEILKRFLIWLCLGIEQPDNPFLPQGNRFLFALYTVAAVVYRWIVVFSILMFLNEVLEPYGLKILGRMIGAVGVFGLVVQPLFQLVKFFYLPGRMHKLKRIRLIGTVAFLVAAVLFVIFVPLPYHVACTLHLEPAAAQAVFAVAPGRLEELRIKPGDHVEAGAVLAVLSNDDLKLTVAKLEGQLEQVRDQVSSLQYQQVLEKSMGDQIPQLEEIVLTTQRQLKEKQEQLEKLEIRAPAAGLIVEPPRVPAQKSNDGRLPGWSGSPFDRKNLGSHLAATDMICQIGDPTRLEAVLVIDQNDIELVDQEDVVEILFDSLPARNLKITTKIQSIASSELKVSPANLASQAGGELNTKIDSSGILRPINTSYQARTSVLEQGDRALRVGLRGKAKIYTGWMPLGARLKRFLSRTFHFDF